MILGLGKQLVSFLILLCSLPTTQACDYLSLVQGRKELFSKHVGLDGMCSMKLEERLNFAGSL